jgi:hypothetical protein
MARYRPPQIAASPTVAPVFIRVAKFTSRFAPAPHGYVTNRTWRRGERELSKNYIDILNDGIDEQRAIVSTEKSGRLVKDYLLRLMAAVLNALATAHS